MNTVVCRVDSSVECVTGVDLLRAIRNAASEALQYQHVPFDLVVNALEVSCRASLSHHTQ